MAHQKITGTIDRTSMIDTAIASSNTTFYTDQDTENYVSVPEGCVVERQVPAGTLDITDTAMGAVVIGSHDTVIDSRGTKTSIKIGKSDATAASVPQYTGSGNKSWNTSDSGSQTSGSVLLNSVVGSDDTNISMEGAVINIKRKKKKGREQASRNIKAGEINLANSAAVSMVAYSERTKVSLQGSEINIE